MSSFPSFSSGLFCSLSLLTYFKRRIASEKVVVFHHRMRLNVGAPYKDKWLPREEAHCFAADFCHLVIIRKCVNVKGTLDHLEPENDVYTPDALMVAPPVPLCSCAQQGTLTLILTYRPSKFTGESALLLIPHLVFPLEWDLLFGSQKKILPYLTFIHFFCLFSIMRVKKFKVYGIESYCLMVHSFSIGEGNGTPTPVLLPGESHGRRILVGYSPWGRTELDTTEATQQQQQQFQHCNIKKFWDGEDGCTITEQCTVCYFFKFILFFNFTMLYWFCHISTWIRRRYPRVPHSESSSLFPPRTISLGRPSAPALSIQYPAWNLLSG